MLTFDTWNDPPSEFHPESDTKGALEVLGWAYGEYGEELVYACSFGIEGLVLLDLISQVKPNADVVFLDTDLHFQETYDVIDQVRERYPSLRILMKTPSLTLEEQARKHGDELWKKDPNLCCQLRKVQPLEEELNGTKAWLSGLRREQSPTRKNVQFVNKDNRFHSVKVCPLIHWTWKEVWRYAHRHDLPYNKLHDQGFPSIGCQPCTRQAINPNDLRSGRWSGQGKLECGLHQDQ
ncbi:phosphoadenylyl-sulfate reductase [Falsibacillus albus]|uniref:Adenosine 5'-phosphosulfate reductase n=1 Tax=Falsibacillus albus TaxID=2478915 RepID=A0A3L7K0G5_9BACI|nr:phosphoadenylyl-sulfate reductase [Falsibacillus albus]RLQ95889.1 phosphoadenylyl-sulfate reductase [Falsibacillus albus]